VCNLVAPSYQGWGTESTSLDGTSAPRPKRDIVTVVRRYQCISLLTDYGLTDGFVASCHGVLARLAPDVRVIDVTHLVPRGDIRRGSALLAQTLPALPRGVHVAVVDPGVGTARRALALAAGEHVLIGPDNGLLPPAADVLASGSAHDSAQRVYEITSVAAMLEPVSHTFHGRDIFAPAAARVAAGELSVSDLGPELDLDSLVRLPRPHVSTGEGWAKAEVLMVDRFGNVQTALPAERLAAAGFKLGEPAEISAGGVRHPVRYAETFGSVPRGMLVMYADSAGYLAVARNGGDAARLLGARPGSLVRVRKGLTGATEVRGHALPPPPGRL
jgi:S-adenosylmethionine hydrolase